MTLSAARSTTQGKILLTAAITGLDNDNYYEVTGHGFVYQLSARLGTRTLTVNTPGRTKVTCSGYKDIETGTYVYNMTPTSANTKYVVRAWVSYTNAKGATVYAYSAPVTVTYNTLQ